MEQIAAFRAVDGRIFDNAVECKKHEAAIGLRDLADGAQIGAMGHDKVIDWMIEHHAKIGELLSAIGRTDNKPVIPPAPAPRAPERAIEAPTAK